MFSVFLLNFRSCLIQLAPAQYKECKESVWCEKCYYDNSNDKLYFLSVAKNTEANNGQGK